jgi:DNA-binding SARP family transcriptional activator
VRDRYEPFARRHIPRLEEQRLVAVEARVEANPALGRHAALVGELEGVVEQRPLRKRLRAQLILTLYRCGRQAEALETYRAGRARPHAEHRLTGATGRHGRS